mgnify:CR=1 FL=1
MSYLYWPGYISDDAGVVSIRPLTFQINDLSPREATYRLDVPKPFEEWHGENSAIYTDLSGLVTDHLDCAHTRVISCRLKEFLEPIIGDEAQFLPIDLKARDGSRSIGGYWIMHVTAMVDCLDLTKCPDTNESNAQSPGPAPRDFVRFGGVYGGNLEYYSTHVLGDCTEADRVLIFYAGPSVVLFADAIPPDLHVFRVKHWYGNHLIIRKDLAEALTQQEFRGLLFKDCQC